MSADNYYIIRKHPDGGYAAVMEFASDDEREPERRAEHSHRQFPTIDAAVRYAESCWSEYGTSIHPECVDDDS